MAGARGRSPGRLRPLLLIAAPTALVIIGGVALLWRAIGGGPMSVHGWIALILGGLGVGALTGILMSLAFHSSRGGHDDQAGRPDPDAPPRRLD